MSLDNETANIQMAAGRTTGGRTTGAGAPARLPRETARPA